MSSSRFRVQQAFLIQTRRSGRSGGDLVFVSWKKHQEQTGRDFLARGFLFAWARRFFLFTFQGFDLAGWTLFFAGGSIYWAVGKGGGT
jgi:hypothetical protein